MSLYPDLLLAERLLQESQRGGVLIAEGADNNRRGLDNLPGVSVLVDLAETSHLTELLLVGNQDKGDTLLLSEGLDELLVGGLIAVLGQEDQLGVSGLDGLGNLMETSDEGSTTAGVLQHFLDRRSSGDFLSDDLSGHYFQLTNRKVRLFIEK